MSIGSEPDEVERFASRLRLLAADLGDEPEADRIAHLNDEVERMLNGRSMAERARLLESLGRQFPRVTFGAASPGEGEAPAPEVGNVEQAIRVIEQEAPSMTEEDRRRLASRLARAGVDVGGRVGWSSEAEGQFRGVVGLRAADSIDADRVLALATMLADTAVKLDKAAWAAWHTLAPRSNVRRRAPLDQAIPGFLRGDSEVPRVRAEEDVERTRRLAALLIGSTGSFGQAAWEWVRHLMPGEIEMDVGKGKHRRLWARYEELASDSLTPHAIEGEARTHLARYVEDGMARRST